MPWFYEKLAILYSKQHLKAKEYAILTRYERQKKPPGAGVIKLAERLAKLRAVMNIEEDRVKPDYL